MKTAINNYIGSLNWGYRVALRDKDVNYVNAYAEFVEPHKIKVKCPVSMTSCLFYFLVSVLSSSHQEVSVNLLPRLC